jgi:fatty-acyl-CoA synthase
VDAAVIGAPDEKWGETVVAYVVLKPGAALPQADLDEHLRDKLAAYKIPRDVRTIDVLPRNASGKVLKTDLRERYAADSA